MDPIDRLPKSMQLTKDKRTAKIELKADLTTVGLEKLMADLAVLRANMLPQVPRTGDSDAQPYTHSFQDDPDVTIQLLRPSLGFRIGLRTQGFGWLAFDIPQDRAIAMRDYFIANTPDVPNRMAFDVDGDIGAAH